MSGVTVTYQLALRRARPVAVKAQAECKPDAARTRPSDRTARRLALAHHIEALVEDGVLRDYAAAARILGLTRCRMTQVMNLLHLAPDLQERLLLGTLNVPERRLRLALRWANWDAQSVAVEGTPCLPQPSPVSSATSPQGRGCAGIGTSGRAAFS